MSEEVELFLREYPPPSPPSHSPEKIFQPRDYRDIDNRARQAPAELVRNFDKLVTYLVKDAKSDIAKVRSIFIWLSDQPVLSTTFPTVVPSSTPFSWLKRIKYDRSLYTDLFAILCRKADIPCAIIRGSSKGAGFQVGQSQELKTTNRWNAVHVQGDWQLVNPCWAYVTTDGVDEGTWTIVEEDGQARREVEVCKKEVTQELDEFWFLTKPEDFTGFFHPIDPRWQLLEWPWSDQDFLNTPRFSEEMFKSDWRLVTQDTGLLAAKQGVCTIGFVHPTENVHYASLMYQLSFSEEQSPKPLPEELQLSRYVVVNSKSGTKSIVTRLPQPGVYRIKIAGLLNDDDPTPLAEFRIECKDIKKEPPPFPEGCEDIGFTEKTAKFFENPSHEEGIVEAKAGEREHSFKFVFAKNKPQPRDIRATITHNTFPPEKLRSCSWVKRTSDDVTVSVTLPKDKNTKTDEFGVCIDVLPGTPPGTNHNQAAGGGGGGEGGGGEGGDNQSADDMDYHNIINYIVTWDSTLNCKEQKAVMQAKSDLLTSIKNCDVAHFYDVYRSMGDLDPTMRAKVAEFLKMITKIKQEKMHELVNAMNGPDLNALEKALKDYESLAEGGKMSRDSNVQMARATLELLMVLKGESFGQEQVGRLEKALGTIYGLGQGTNSNVIRAEEALCSYYEKELGEAYYKRSLEVLVRAVSSVDQSVIKDRVKGQFMFSRVTDLQKHLMEMKKLTDKVGQLKTKDFKKMAGTSGRSVHPHVHSVLMATFLLLGEREADLWEWNIIQNLLERRSEVGVAKAMAKLNVDELTNQQVSLAEGHVRVCQLEILKNEDPNTALFLQWVQSMVAEKREREAVTKRRDLCNVSSNVSNN